MHGCLLFHGRYGYSEALFHQQRLRDIIGWQIDDGSEEVMKLLIACSRFGREIFDSPVRREKITSRMACDRILSTSM